MRPTALLGVALVLALAGCGGSDGSDPASTIASTPSAPGSDRPSGVPSGVEAVELDAGPVGVADVGGEAWTVLVDAGAVRTGDDRRIPVGRAPLRLVATPEGVWVSVIGNGTVVRIDPETAEVDRRVRLGPRGSEPEGLAWDGSSLWVVDQAHGRVVELDEDGEVVRSVPTDDAPRLVAAGPSGVWVANYGGTSVTRVSGAKARTVPVPGCVGPQGIAELAGRVWISCTLNGTVVALDVRTLRPVVAIEDLPDPDAVVATGDAVYVVGEAGPTVWSIDPGSGEIRDTLTLDDAMPTSENVGAAVVGGELVVTHPDAKTIYTLPLP